MRWKFLARLWLTAIAVVGIVSAFTACSVVIARSGISSSDEIPKAGVTRKEIHERFGQPDSSALCTDGKRIDVHAIRQEIASSTPWLIFDEVVESRMLLWPLVELLWFTPSMLYKSEVNKIHVAFVYWTDDVLASRTWTAKGTEPAALCAEHEKGQEQEPQEHEPIKQEGQP